MLGTACKCTRRECDVTGCSHSALPTRMLEGGQAHLSRSTTKPADLQRCRAAPRHCTHHAAIVEAATPLKAPGQSYLIVVAATMTRGQPGSSATKPMPPACKRQVVPSASRARWQQVQQGYGRMRSRQGGGTAYPVSACEGGMCTHLRACPRKHSSFSRDWARAHEPSVGSRSSHACNGSETVTSSSLPTRSPSAGGDPLRG